jgi:hypothetical protein
MLVRSYVLPVYPNSLKKENIRYTCNRFVQYTQNFTNLFYYSPFVKSSTKGMGALANKAQRRHSSVLRADSKHTQT